MRDSVARFYKAYRIELLITLIAIPYLVAQTLHGGDFRILLRAGEYLCRGESPYGKLMHIHEEVWDVFLYTPFVGFIIMPFTYLPEFIPSFAFNLLNFFLLFKIWPIIMDWLGVNELDEKQKRWWLILTVFLILRFILHNFENNQMNILVLYLSLLGLNQILLQGKNTGGVLLALGICLKILPIMFLPYLLYRRKMTALLIVVSVTVLLLLLPAVWFGVGFEKELLAGWWAAIDPVQDKYNAGQNNGIIFHCITALIPVYFSDCSYRGFSVNIMNLDKQQLFLVINTTRALMILLVLYFLWMGRSAKNNSRIFIFWELSYLFLLIPLIFPNQNKYAYINLLPAYGYIAYYLVSIFNQPAAESKKQRTILLVMLSFVVIFTVLTADIFWGMEIGKYFQFMKLITVGTLMLIPMLVYFSPHNIVPDRNA